MAAKSTIASLHYTLSKHFKNNVDIKYMAVMASSSPVFCCCNPTSINDCREINFKSPYANNKAQTYDYN